MAILKQQILFEKIIENQGKPASEQKSLYQLILSAGYSEQSASNPKAIFEAASWQELVSLIPKNELLTKLIKNAFSTRSIHGSNTAIDMLLKVIGGYAPAKMQISTDEEMTDEELEKKIQEKKKQIEEQEKGANQTDSKNEVETKDNENPGV